MATVELQEIVAQAVRRLEADPSLGKPSKLGGRNERSFPINSHRILYAFDPEKNEVTLLELYPAKVFFV